MAASKAMMQPSPKNASGTYTYSSQPRAVQQEKYREEAPGAYGNIMYDRRVIRGNTYALHTLPASSQPDPLEVQRQQEARRRAIARKRAREQFKPRSPDAVEGRKHIDVQTELYLEEITDRVEEADVVTQTDAFLDRPPTPLFIPAKTGLDAATQIQDGDLFDFDLEVKPILEVLVGKTVEQSLLEVMEEEELANLRAQQREFEENRNAELVETQRLQEQERRRRQEKERRMKQQRDALLKEKETAEKIAARAFAQSYLSDLVPSVFSTLTQNGFFYDPVEREVESVFMPWLMREAETVLDENILARMVLDALVRDTVSKLLSSAPPVISIPSSGESTTASDPQPAVVTEQPPPAEPLLKVFGVAEEETKEPSEGDNAPTEKGSEEDAEQESESAGQAGESESFDTVPSADSGDKNSSEADKPPETEGD